MATVDVIVAPSRAGNSGLIGNLTGQPCVVLPDGFDEAGSPTSLCLIGRLYDEARLLAVAKALQDAGGFHRQHPDLSRLVNRVRVPRLAAEVTLDGRLDEPVWEAAAKLHLEHNDGSGAAWEDTTVRLWYDAEALHLGWTCRDADSQATFTERDSRGWEDEGAGFFGAPGGLTKY